MSERVRLGNFEALQESAVAAACYLDAFERHESGRKMDAALYLRCADLLGKIFAVTDPWRAFPVLMTESPAAREIADSITMTNHLEVSCLFYYPELTLAINRMLNDASIGSERH